MKEEITIKRVEEKDISKLQEISKKTFADTFSSSNSEEDMQKYLTESFSEDQLLKELKNQNSLFFFAMINQEIVGYLKLNIGDAQTEIYDMNSLEIERIYVLESFQGKKIGQILFNKALEMTKNFNLDTIWLGVWEKNVSAISFYLKNGFEKFDQHIFRLGDDEQIDYMMRLEL
ncbi:GNAT family N-acetyltransferase [Empedobacter falsenii]|uniref:GNAT family N-acetyltransferase n=1 Tax=Empedobacter falsenii TaxID=343874 RepID=UPI002575F3E9|nr:GNAT family N-acetyltransferase [Empedobacter falsenii]MDM1549182.1 GNAT family N-acetyltransferase [Empedobacter falsenii]